MTNFGGEPTLPAERHALVKRQAAEREDAQRRTMLKWLIGIALTFAAAVGVPILIAAQVIG